MSILGRVLMLVACVPLLQPTGFCVCKAGDRERTSPRQEPVAVGAISPTTNTKAGCCSQRHNAAATHTPTESEPVQPHPCPAPADDDHMPGCPASVGVDRYKWVEPAQSFAEVLPPVVGSTFLPIEVAAPAARPVPPPTNWPSSPPLYLSHCSLVI